MCGIAGIYNNSLNNQNSIKKIIKKIKHRGPDAEGFWIDEFVALGSVRLKVVDLDEKSNQPLLSNNKKFLIVFNGEIYNYLLLKKKYNLKTRTNSDTEIILELFSKLGPKTFSLLEGMFAISIYDIQNKSLYLARDSFGIKPLYYILRKNNLIFCSEIKGILEVEKNIVPDNESIINFVKWGGIDHSNKTFFKNINSLEPGTFAIINKNLKLEKKRYYSIENEIKQNKYKKKDIPLIFNELLKESIKEQSRTVRSLGTNLSGGVDSSIVTTLLKEVNADINTYTFGFNEKKFDERPFAKYVAKKLKLENNVSVTSFSDINTNFINTLLNQDEPFTSFRQVSHHKLYSDFKSYGSTVIMEASGGDELGAGYTGFIWPFFLDDLKKVGYKNAVKTLYSNLKSHKFDIRQINKFIESGIYNQKFYGSSTSDGEKIIEQNCLLNYFEKKFDNGPVIYRKPFGSHLLNSQYIELFHTKLPRGLRYVDRASSSSGREARVPLLNKKIVEFCFSIPNDTKIKNGELRFFMKESLNFLGKKKIILSNKRSIADPQRIWMRKNLNKLFIKVFKSKTFSNRGIFNSNQVLKSFKNFLKNERMHSLGLFQIFITEIWFRLFFDNKSENFQNIKLDDFIDETND